MLELYKGFILSLIIKKLNQVEKLKYIKTNTTEYLATKVGADTTIKAGV